VPSSLLHLQLFGVRHVSYLIFNWQYNLVITQSATPTVVYEFYVYPLVSHTETVQVRISVWICCCDGFEDTVEVMKTRATGAAL
jgi:hypothetical protein